MTVREQYEESYLNYSLGNLCAGNKYVWAAEEVFGLITYDNDMSELFAKSIFNVLDVIDDGHTFEYIHDENCYIEYLIVCQLLDQFHWIDWGTSIRGAYLYDDSDSKEIIDGVPFNRLNLLTLMLFVEDEKEKENA